MARKKRRRQVSESQQGPRWNWSTFPVLAGFTAGGVAVLLLVNLLPPPMGAVVSFYAFLALSGFVLSHLVFSGLLRSWFMRRQRSRTPAAQQPRQAPPPV